MVDTFQKQRTFPVPPLESGDRLSRHEFERRYAATPEKLKAELIEGVVYVAAALRFRSHGQPHGRMMTWLGVYEAATPGVAIGDNSTVRLDLDNEPQPDAVLIIESSGQAQISDDDYLEGAPELVVEIAASSASIDLHDKKRAYRRNGVQEYLVWRVLDHTIDWFYLQDGEYISLIADQSGIIKSVIFPGLWLAVSDLLNGNMQAVLAVLQQGISSTDHAALIERLKS